MLMDWMRRSRTRDGTAAAAAVAAADGRATAADIAACFRLLLGRPPGEEERIGHLAQVGRPLDEVVRGYLGSAEFKERRLLDSESGGWAPVRTASGFSIYASPEDVAVGRPISWDGSYEPNVSAAFARHLRPGTRVIDIGANIGWFTMLAAASVGPDGHVLAVEPNPLNARLLEASRLLNGFAQVSLLPVAAGMANGAAALHRTYSNGSTTSLDRVDVLSAEIVPVIRLDDVVFADGRPVAVVKVDVEGAEGLALGGLERTLRRDRPVILSEFSPNMMPGASGTSGLDYLGWLRGLGYRIGVIEEDGSVSPCASPAAALDAHARSGVDHVDLELAPE